MASVARWWVAKGGKEALAWYPLVWASLAVLCPVNFNFILHYIAMIFCIACNICIQDGFKVDVVVC